VTPSHPGADDDAPLRSTEVKMDQYEIRVRGRVTPPLLARFEGLQSQVEPVETVLHGPLADQAALHGVIDLVRALGLELVEVRKIPVGRGDDPAASHGTG
jgi:hypothetical protein